jgi:hypothetical protein
MAQGGGTTLLGVATLGFGTIILVAAYRNRKVFGPQGILTQAITTGTIPQTGSVPPAFASSSADPNRPEFPLKNSDAGGYTISGPGGLYDALVDISTHNYGLATKTTRDFAILTLGLTQDNDGSTINLAKVRNDANNDIAMTESLGLHSDALVLRSSLDNTSNTMIGAA